MACLYIFNSEKTLRCTVTQHQIRNPNTRKQFNLAFTILNCRWYHQHPPTLLHSCWSCATSQDIVWFPPSTTTTIESILSVLNQSSNAYKPWHTVKTRKWHCHVPSFSCRAKTRLRAQLILALASASIFSPGGANQRTRPGEELRKIQAAFYHELTWCRVVQTREKEEKLLYWSATSSTVTSNTRPFRQKFKKKCPVYQNLEKAQSTWLYKDDGEEY